MGMDRLRVEVIRTLANSSIAQYAVIEARKADGPSERFVFAYSDEESLRDLIAKPSIIASGFASREQAEANINTVSRIAVWKRIQNTFVFGRVQKDLRRLLFAKSFFGAASELTHKVSRVRDFVASAVAAGTFTFYSRSAVFSVLRFLLGSSF